MITTTIHQGVNHLIKSLTNQGIQMPKVEADLLREDLRAVLQDIYDEYAPDDELQPVEAYLQPEGVKVLVDEMEDEDCRLRLLPDPARFILTIGYDPQVVWQEEA